MKRVGSKVRSDDSSRLRLHLRRHAGIADLNQKADMGWSTIRTAEFLVPMTMWDEYCADKERWVMRTMIASSLSDYSPLPSISFRRDVAEGRIVIRLGDLANYLYDRSRVVPGRAREGLLYGPLLIKVCRYPS